MGIGLRKKAVGGGYEDGGGAEAEVKEPEDFRSERQCLQNGSELQMALTMADTTLRTVDCRRQSHHRASIPG